MVLIYISLMISDVEDLCLCLYAICIPSLKKYLLKSFAHFLHLIWGGAGCWVVVLYIFWILTLHQITRFAIFFFFPIPWVAFLLLVVFWCTELFDQVQFIYFFPLVTCGFGVMSYRRNHCRIQFYEAFFPVYTQSSMVLSFVFFVPFQVNFCMGYKVPGLPSFFCM